MTRNELIERTREALLDVERQPRNDRTDADREALAASLVAYSGRS